MGAGAVQWVAVDELWADPMIETRGLNTCHIGCSVKGRSTIVEMARAAVGANTAVGARRDAW